MICPKCREEYIKKIKIITSKGKQGFKFVHEIKKSNGIDIEEGCEVEKSLIKNNVLEYDAVREFIEFKIKSEKECRSYKSGINQFFIFLEEKHPEINLNEYIPMRTITDTSGGKPIEWKTRKHPFNDPHFMLAKEKIRQDIIRDCVYKTDSYKEDIEAWKEELKNTVSVNTINSYLTILRVFFTYFNILDAEFWKTMRITKVRDKDTGEKLYKYNARAEEPITHEFLQDMLKLSDNVKDRAIILCLASSGLRIGELFKIKLEDIELDKNPVQINVAEWVAKNGKERITFISKEAAKEVKKWLEKDKDGKSLRSKYLESAVKKIMHKNEDGSFGLITMHGLITKDINDNSLFPLSDDTFHKIWIGLLKKTGNDARGTNTTLKFHLYRVHGLRKWFRNNVAKCDYPRAEYLSEQLLGHTSNHPMETYSEEKLAKDLSRFYLKAETQITVFKQTSIEAQTQLAELQQKQLESDDKIKELEERVKEMRDEDRYISNFKEVVKEK